jgi:very-short-patch-repair endonuclease
MALSPVELALTRWRNNLIDLSRRNPLIALRAGRSSLLEINRPDAETLFRSIVLEERTWGFGLPGQQSGISSQATDKSQSGAQAAPSDHEPLTPDSRPLTHDPCPPTPDSCLLTTETDRTRLIQTLTNLYRRARADFRERGLHILHLAFGVLTWKDPGEETLQSPLVLVPVELERHSLREPFRLKPGDEDPWLNPALASRLRQDFEFKLPQPPEDWEEKTLTAYFDELSAAITGLPGWQLERRVVLSLFSFYKGVIYQDLEDNAGRIHEHALVQALAGMPASLPRAVLPAEDQLDQKQDPQATFHILDADASQRLCLDAAAQGESFVLIGPPGTGKSQTISNLIADRIGHGKQVLFVSEKMAALEIVYERLKQAGLGDFCLELHSHKANKRAVVAELARCWNDRQRPRQDTAGSVDSTRLAERRDRLNRYVNALHQRREPIGKSAWDVLAEMPRWRTLPVLPLGLPLTAAEDAKTSVAEFTSTRLDEAVGLCRRAGQLWHIRADAEYPWTGFKADRFSLQLRDEIIGLLDKMRPRGEKLLEAVEKLGEEFDVQATAKWLLKLADLLEHRPAPIPPAWFAEEDLDRLGHEADQAAAKYHTLTQARGPLTSRYGEAIWDQEDGAARELEATWRPAAELLAPDERGTELLKLQQRLRGWTADTQKRLPAWLSDLRALEKWLGIALSPGAGAVRHVGTAGEGHDPSPHAVKLLLRLTHLCHTDHPAERNWCVDVGNARAAAELAGGARPDFAKYRQDRQHLLQTYTEQLFELELDRIAAGYEGPYRRWFAFLSGTYRRDRRAIQRRTKKYEVPATVAQDMPRARDVQAIQKKLEAETPRRWQHLGRYERGLDTDVEGAERGAKAALEAFDIVCQLGMTALPEKLIDALCSGKPPEKVRASMKRLQESFGAWLHETHALGSILPMGLLAATGEPLEESALTAVIDYAKALQAKLNPLGEATGPLLKASANPPPDLATLVEDVRQAEDLLKFETTQETEAAAWHERFGDLEGIETDWDKLRKSIAFARKLRSLWRELGRGDEPPEPTEGFVSIVVGQAKAPSFQQLRHAHDQFQQAVHALEQRFDAPGPKFRGKPWRECDAETVHFHSLTLRDRAGELADWLDWRQLPARFDHLGLTEFWTAVLEHAAPNPPLADLFALSFWSRWLEWVFSTDSALRDFRRAEHEVVIDEFRAQDRQTLAHAADRIVQRRAEQWREPEQHEVALLMKESHKKTKHLPLRRLFEGMPRLLGQLKPCLLMSPLSVSQFLPADVGKLKFDLVVFDEASQIVPEDAIGAIYRGEQIVVTGDNQQLPPTTFFQQLSEDGEETEEDPGVFESILDTSLGTGLPRQWLRWHYRSRHEYLIAFSNERYYDNKLVTFPGAIAEDADYGVKFQHVPDGKYDRGGRRDNPREAQVVADLVLEHLRRTPDKSLGVIAFSYPQMEAIENELDRRLAEHPELEKLLHEERLDGFFIKNLETVQGDERDVILLSVGYGPDEQRKIALNFGPLNCQGGERRLNVAVTRARQKLILVSSIRASDIRPSTAKGIVFLQQYLDYAEHGLAARRPGADGDASLHALAADVRQELVQRGYETALQVGCASYRIDLAVLDPQRPGNYLLGIEFDGPTYSQAAAARDRDRLRHEVMQRLGWKLHRIWSPAWLHRRQEELERLLAALHV